MPAMPAIAQTPATPTWSRIYIKDPYLHDAVGLALRGASGYPSR